MHSRRYRSLRIPPCGLVAALMIATPTVDVLAQVTASAVRAEIVRPSLDLWWSGGVPDARGDGAAMSGVGLDARLLAGIRGSAGAVRFRLVPELVFNGNADHQTFPSGDASRDRYASSFYHGAFSADLPSRPGSASRTLLAFGESAIWWSSARVFAGAMTTTPRWGPGRPAGDTLGADRLPGEGLVLGRSAPGLPRIETALAWSGGAGVTRVRWFGGLAQESRWFDSDRANDTRPVAGLRVEFERAGAVAVGVSRTVMGIGGASAADGALGPFRNARRGAGMEILAGDIVYGVERTGTTMWLELARQEPVRSAGGWLRAPSEGLAMRTGFSQRIARGPAADWEATVEFVRLDQAATRDDVPPTDLYTSAVVVHGWTHQGQPLGSGLGPGGQRQFAGVERIGRVWRLGATLERVRWNEDALLRQAAPASDRHDVSLLAGLAAARPLAAHVIRLELSVGRRVNYLFQGPSSSPSNQATDLSVLRFGLRIAPLARASRIVGVLPEP